MEASAGSSERKEPLQEAGLSALRSVHFPTGRNHPPGHRDPPGARGNRAQAVSPVSVCGQSSLRCIERGEHHAWLVRGDHCGRAFVGSPLSQEAQRSPNQRGRDARVDQASRQATSGSTARASEAKACRRASAGRPARRQQATDAGRPRGRSREQRGGMEGNTAVSCSEVEDLPLPAFDTTFSWSKSGGPGKPPHQRHRRRKRLEQATRRAP